MARLSGWPLDGSAVLLTLVRWLLALNRRRRGGVVRGGADEDASRQRRTCPRNRSSTVATRRSWWLVAVGKAHAERTACFTLQSSSRLLRFAPASRPARSGQPGQTRFARRRRRSQNRWPTAISPPSRRSSRTKRYSSAAKVCMRGKAGSTGDWKRFFDGPAAPFSWAPAEVEVLPSGTLGIHERARLRPEGQPHRNVQLRLAASERRVVENHLRQGMSAVRVHKVVVSLQSTVGSLQSTVQVNSPSHQSKSSVESRAGRRPGSPKTADY